jgi:hypothetical protein
MKKHSGAQDWDRLESNPAGPAEYMDEIEEVPVDTNIQYKPYQRNTREVANNRNSLIEDMMAFYPQNNQMMTTLWKQKMDLEDAINKKITQFNQASIKFSGLLNKLSEGKSLNNKDELTKQRWDQIEMNHRVSLSEDLHSLTDISYKIYNLFNNQNLEYMAQSIDEERIKTEDILLDIKKKIEESIKERQGKISPNAKKIKKEITVLDKQIIQLKANYAKGQMNATEYYKTYTSLYKKKKTATHRLEKETTGPDPNLIKRKGWIPYLENRIRELDRDLAVIDDIIANRPKENTYVPTEQEAVVAFNLKRIKMA